MPCQTDLYFPPDDNALEVRHMPNAVLRPIPSLWGHMAGRPGANPVDTAFIDNGSQGVAGELRVRQPSDFIAIDQGASGTVATKV